MVLTCNLSTEERNIFRKKVFYLTTGVAMIAMLFSFEIAVVSSVFCFFGQSKITEIFLPNFRFSCFSFSFVYARYWHVPACWIDLHVNTIFKICGFFIQNTVNMVQISISDGYIPNYFRNSLISSNLYIQMQTYERMNQ